MTSNSEQTSIRTRAALPSLQLQSWPPRDETVRTLTLAGLELMVSAVAGRIAGHWTTSLLVACLLGAASWEFWLPVKYEFGPKGITRQVFYRRRRIAWSEFTRYEIHAHGVFLRHQTDQQPFGAVRGLYLPSRSPHGDLLPVLDYYLKPRSDEQVATTQTLIP